MTVMNEANMVKGDTQAPKVTEILLALAEQINAAGNQTTARKINEVVEKWTEQHLNIGFCGHFSAGKSTMINRLLNKSLLPSSPIPTSANLVLMRYGRPRAVIHLTDGEKVEVDVEQIERWKEYCKDGQLVERVEIFDDHPLLEQGLQLLDTPGIDSTDDAHQAATEAALHLADIIFFVTDYNHVQSELNFEFIRSLQEKGKTLVLLINQIDKHREEEISFAAFDQRIRQGLKEWGNAPDALVYASMKQPEHPLNQFEQVDGMIQLFKERKSDWLLFHAIENSKALLREHQHYLLEQQKAGMEQEQIRLEQIKQELDWEKQSSWFKEYEKALEGPALWKEHLQRETVKILENAILTPYVTTQLAQQYIESRRKDFKVGLLFSGKKTEQERANRLAALYKDLQERIETQVEWHLKELLRKTADSFGIQEQSFKVQLLEWRVEFSPELIEKSVQEGVVSNEYVYTYTKGLVQEIRRGYTLEMERWVDKGQALLKQEMEEKYAPFREKLALYQEMQVLKSDARSRQEEIQRQIDGQIAHIAALQEYGLAGESLHQLLKQVRVSGGQPLGQSQAYPSSANGRDGAQVIQENVGKAGKRKGNEIMSVGPEEASFDNEQAGVSSLIRLDSLHKSGSLLQQTSKKLIQAKELLTSLSATEALRADLGEKAQRLSKNRFRVCLFGAFSAGKSSFANALLGEAVLPVSPNPTTAAINQVLPPTKEYPSGSAVVKMKSKEQVAEEINIALNRLQLTAAGDTWERLQAIQGIDPLELRASLKPYYTFLAACRKGWREAQALLDTEFLAEHSDYTEFVAVEHKACFVQSIQLYHENPVTAQGIEIIDTPGADSIYSRHTNVTFNYLKHADVIIYVTYYNHAFSRADRQFLDQLGRVKDQFALDKMFFLVNAADLAESEEELQAVVQHVEDNLLRSGIRFPRIFPVSSLRALQGQPDAGMRSFTASFTSFIEQELTELLVGSALRDIQYGKEWLMELKSNLLGSQTDKEQHLERLGALQESWTMKIQEKSYASYFNEIEQEIREHTFHIKQRLFFGFLEHVQEAFHPSVLSGKGITPQLLNSCLEECLFSIGFQLQEELKATSLRLEGFLHKLLQRASQEWQKEMKQDGIYLPESSVSVKDLGIPEIPKSLGAFTEKEAREISRHFKSPKQFFEGDGRTLLREELEKKMHILAERYLEEAHAVYTSYYQNAWQAEESRYKRRVIEDLEASVAGKAAALKGEIKIEELDQLLQRYDSILLGMEEEVGSVLK